MMKLLRRFMNWSLGKRWPRGLIIPDPYSGGDYLKRCIFLKRKWFSIYLHNFVIGDHDRHMHNHPWSWAFSIILCGSYTEHRLGGKPRRVRWFNFLTFEDYHRVTELHGEVWTLFLCGPRKQDWGFLVKGKHIQHEEYFDQVRRAKESERLFKVPV